MNLNFDLLNEKLAHWLVTHYKGNVHIKFIYGLLFSL